MERSNKYDLTCSHCGEFISINIPTDENIINDSSVEKLKLVIHIRIWYNQVAIILWMLN